MYTMFSIFVSNISFYHNILSKETKVYRLCIPKYHVRFGFKMIKFQKLPLKTIKNLIISEI